MLTIPLPPTPLRFMNEDDEQLVTIGSDLARDLYAHGLGPGQRLLDVGCGYGRLAIGLMHTDFAGDYVGFDILPRHIKWCREHLATEHYDFRHLDVRNDRYNRKGKVDPEQATFPVRSANFDACSLFSVFTHMYRANIERYLAEIHRSLKPGGWAATTWLLFDDDRLEAVTASSARYPLVHEIDPTCRYESEEDPLKAIGYHERAVREMAGAAGLEIVEIRRGSWAGDLKVAGFQDLVVLRRPVTMRNRIGRIKRALTSR
ncbi:cyclopropane-fatty-acyl-phospholipid synthase family protein [Nocardioides sp.]|uniref:SAM-dependent methyltransferase n=1 Tax=Nocardioides sp. TaxID=35761 RepID=UPI0035661D61